MTEAEGSEVRMARDGGIMRRDETVEPRLGSSPGWGMLGVGGGGTVGRRSRGAAMVGRERMAARRRQFSWPAIALETMPCLAADLPFRHLARVPNMTRVRKIPDIILGIAT